MDLVKNICLVALLVLGCSSFAAKKDTELKSPSKSQGQQGRLPKLEAGVAGGFFTLPHYPGSNQMMNRVLFLPYFAFRGESVKVDRQGRIRMDVIESETYDVDVSVNGSFSSNSSDNDARRGMEDIDWLGEIGPKLMIHLQKPKNGAALIDLNFPVRALFSTDFYSGEDQGLVFAPNIIYRKTEVFGSPFTFVTSFSTTFATRKLMEFFYQVEQKDVTPTRSAYDPKGGYLKSQILVGSIYSLSKDIILFAGGRYSNFKGATNKASPLHVAEDSTSIGVGLSWRMYSSKETVLPDWRSEVY